MLPTPEIIVRNYNPDTDFPDIKKNLVAAGLYVEGQDSKDRLDSFASRLPTSILVAHYADSATIQASLSIPDSVIPFIARFALNPNCEHPEKVTKVIYNASYDVLRDRGAPHVEELYDYGQSPASYWQRLGFEEAWTLTAVIRPLWLPDGTPYPNI